MSWVDEFYAKYGRYPNKDEAFSFAMSGEFPSPSVFPWWVKLAFGGGVIVGTIALFYFGAKRLASGKKKEGG